MNHRMEWNSLSTKALNLGLRYVLTWEGTIDGQKIDENTSFEDVNRTISMNEYDPLLYDCALMRYLIGQKAFIVRHERYKMKGSNEDFYIREIIHKAADDVDLHAQIMELKRENQNLKDELKTGIPSAYGEGWMDYRSFINNKFDGSKYNISHSKNRLRRLGIEE